MLLSASALALGFLHGLGADHLMAIATLAIGEPTGEAARARAFGVAVRFAAGHALLLAAGVSLVLVLGWTIPVAAERGGEMLGGLLLVVLGVLGLWAVVSGHLYAHVHADGGGARPHWHLHVGRADRHRVLSHHASHLPAIAGAVFAVSSLRALSLLTPFGAQAALQTLPVLLALVVLFGVGILISMSLFGVVLARVVSTRAVSRLGSTASVVTSSGSIGLGVYWIMRV
jgi:hypothetical protein